MLGQRLKTAAEEGLVCGVKWAVAILIVAVVIAWALGDYAVVRQRSLNGQVAFECWQHPQACQAPAGK
jgi:hypothetical protein